MKKMIFLMPLLWISALGATPPGGPKLIKKLESYCTDVATSFAQIPPARKAQLEELGTYIAEQRMAGQAVKMTVICTHNSRRSHMGQLWLSAAAVWYGVEDVQVFSGGTEATAFNIRAVDALNRAGFRITRVNQAENATYRASFLKGAAQGGILMFSKKYDNPQNPSADFAAVMVCSEADRSCPVVPGADARLAIPFDDPRHFDGTPAETAKYDEAVQLIAREMFYAMYHAKDLMIRQQEGAQSTHN